MKTKHLLVAAALLASGAAAMAQANFAISRAVFVESVTPSGKSRTITPASGNLKQGDRVILMIKWSSAQARKSAVVQSAIPPRLAFQRSSVNTAEYSVDGGKIWGRLGDLKKDGRLASPEEVTHLRLRVTGDKPGQITYSAIVR